MPVKLMGKKLGMTHLFDEKGNRIVCTVIQVEPNVVVQIKTKEKDGYFAVQTGYGKVTTKSVKAQEKRVKKPIRGHFKKANVDPRRHLIESRTDDVQSYSVGQEISLSLFKDVSYLDAAAFSIGKGFQGAMKKHNFGGMRASHGTGPVHRHLGSTGNRSTPGRCFPGGKRASQMGNKRTTVQNLKVIEINEEENLIVIKGSVPGAKNSVVTLTRAIKRGA